MAVRVRVTNFDSGLSGTNVAIGTVTSNVNRKLPKHEIRCFTSDIMYFQNNFGVL